MSDETEDRPNSKKEKESDFDKDLKKSPLSPANEDLWNFLVSLFQGDGEFPERIEVRTVKGRNKDQYGIQIKQYIFKSGSEKPNNERLVMMTNEIMRRIRIHTDVAQREQTFMVGAMHAGRSDDFFEIMTLTVKPGKKYRNGEHGDLEQGDDEDMTFAQKHNLAMLGHQERMFALMGGMLEGLVDRSDRQAAAAQADAEQMRARYIELLEANLRLVQADDERAERREKSKMWRENISKGIDMAWNILPPMLSSFKGPNAAAWTPGADSSDAYTLRESFFKSKEAGGSLLSERDLEIICGKFDAEGNLSVVGALKIEQVQIMALVAKKEANPNELDKLLPGGPYEIKQEQIMQVLQAGVSPEALAPLKILFEVRAAAAQAKQNGQGEK